MENNENNQQQPVAPAPATSPVMSVEQPAKQGSGLGITALVLGIISILGSWIPILSVFTSLPLAIIGGVFGIVGIVKNNGKGMAIAGLVISIVSILVITLMNVLVVSSDEFQEGFWEGYNEGMETEESF